MSVVILPYLEEHDKFKKAIDSLKRYSPELKILAVKDRKRKGPDSILTKEFLEAKEDVILWHADIYAVEGWFIDLMKYYDNFDIIGTKLIYPNGLIQHYGGWVKNNGECFHPHIECIDYGFNEPQECPFVTFGGCLIKKIVIDKLGGMDESYFPTYYGDVDYCLRARKAGFKVGVVPVKLIHEEGFDNKKNPEIEELIKRNHKVFLSKWAHELNICIPVPTVTSQSTIKNTPKEDTDIKKYRGFIKRLFVKKH